MSTLYTNKKKSNYNIPLCVPEIRGNEWRYIKECLDANWVSSAGSYVDAFESAVKTYIGRDYAVACSNGTAALHMALLAAGIGADEEVLVPALTFAATANVVRYVGAWPVFMDVRPDIWQMDLKKMADFLACECEYLDGRLINRHTKRIVRAILPVHLLGHPVDMYPLCDLARQYNLIVIEDAAQSMGALYKDRRVGTLGDIACFSFNGNKIITTGAGGMIVTDNQQWAERVRYLTTQAKDDLVELIHNEIGYNYRLSNLHAAMGVAQMEVLDEYIAAKRLLAGRYNEGLRDVVGITLPVQAEWAESIFWLYAVLIDGQKFGMSSRKVLSVLKSKGIQTRPLWHPLHTMKPFECCYAYRVETADVLYRDGLCLPSSVGLAQKDQDWVIETLYLLQKG